MIRIMMLAVLLTACGGGGGDNTPTTPPAPPTPPTPTYPAEGTVVDEECSADEQGVKITTYNDGSGGTYTEREEQSADCGFDIDDYNTIIADYCEGTTRITIRGDGFGGTREYGGYDNAPECKSARVTYGNLRTTYFRPAEFQLVASITPDISASIGRVEVIRTDPDRHRYDINIYSDGRLGEGSLTVNGRDYPYLVEEDPICENTITGGTYKVDCLGNETGGRSAGMIYYGEDDTTIVQIEVGFVRSTSRYPDAEPGTRVPDGHEVRKEVEDFIVWANEFNAKSKVYIEFVISDIVWEDPWQSIYDFGGGSVELMEISDIVYGWGGSGGVHGQAFQTTSIWPDMQTVRVVGVQLYGTAIHEIGHGMGLGHGIWGDTDWTLETHDSSPITGSIFPRFGHGWSANVVGEGVCGIQGSVMSYSSKLIWSNSLVSCEELEKGPGNWGDAAGNRQQSDEAYALNRARYSMSLVHNEHLYGQVDPEIRVAEVKEPEPEDEQVWVGDTCPRSGTLQTGLVDCQGYAVTTSYPEEGYTYYGEDDTTVVTWEVALLVFDNDCAPIVNGQKQAGICDRPLTSFEMDRAENIIAEMQASFDTSRVYVNLDLQYVRIAYFTGLPTIPQTDFNVDAVLAFGGSSPGTDGGGVICGYGGFNNAFDRPLRPWGICGVKDLLHELGHTVGLAHGPDNSRNPASGYIFPNFGHGGGSAICGGYGSIMSYDTGNSAIWSNSLYPCNEVAPTSLTRQAGIRGPNGYDEAYSINRVRYNVANINGE